MRNEVFFLDDLAALWVNGYLGHVQGIGDSNFGFVGPSGGAQNYLITQGFFGSYRRQWDYVYVPTTNTSAQVPGRASFSNNTPTGFTFGAYTFDAPALTSLSAYAGSLYLNDTQPFNFTQDLATDAWWGNGDWRINGQFSVTSPGFGWPNTLETGRPWYHGSHVRSCLVLQDLAGTVRQFQLQLSRAKGGTQNVSTALQVILGTASGSFLRTALTAALADAGNYQTASPGEFPNDHDLRLRPYTRSTAYNENGLTFVPVMAGFFRSDSGGNLTQRADGSRLGACFFSRPGANVAQALTYASQAQAQAVLASLVVPGTTPRIVFMFNYGANIDPGHKSGNAFTPAFISDYVTLIQRWEAAARAAFPGIDVKSLILVPPRVGEGGAITNEASARSIHEACKVVRTQTGASMYSYAAAFGFQEFHYYLHPSTYGVGPQMHMMLDAAMMETARYPATQRLPVAGPGLLARGLGASPDMPPSRWEACTPKDGEELPFVTTHVMVQTAGALAVTWADGSTDSVAMPANTPVRMRVRQIVAAGTTAGGIYIGM